MSQPEVAISVLVATRNRGALLARLLSSLETAQRAAQIDAEIIVVDNGSSDHTPEFLRNWSAAAASRITLRVDEPGKSRALNRALAVAKAPLLAFLDDDEEAAPQWFQAIVAFCAEHAEYHAATGRVLRPPGVTDPELLTRLAWYRTVAFFDDGESVHDKQTLYGGNMVVRRSTFERIGTFDERLGPGAAGGWEDIDLAERMWRAGLRIGYMPGAVVYHAIDPARLTPEYFRHHNVVAARSAYAINPRAATTL